MTELQALATRYIVILPILLVSACSGLDAGSSFTLEFPPAISLGRVSMVEDVNCFTCGTGHVDLGAATGDVHGHLPASHWYVSLTMPRDASRLMPYLTHPSLAAIGDLNLEGSDVSDEDLQYVKGMHLRSINLAGTRITGAGLRYVNEHPKWTWIDLRRCTRLDVESLARFKGWTRATIRLLPYISPPDTYPDAERRLLERARHVVCADQGEDVCGTQIR